MNPRSPLATWSGILLVIIGIGIGLSLSGIMTWGEIESGLAATPSESKKLTLSCPLMLSKTETGIVQAEIVNEIAKEVQPVVTARFGQQDTASQRAAAQTFILAPGETQTAQWQVDSSDAVFNRLIPVAVIQSRYNLNPPRWGTCGILLFSLFGLNGASTLTVLILASILFIATGIILSRAYFASQGDRLKHLSQMGAFLALLAMFALVSSCIRWWGLTLLLETLAAITVGNIITELIVPHHGRPE